MYMSLKKLKAAGACSLQVAKFRRRFGTRAVKVTEALCVKHAQVFDWSWAAVYLLPTRAHTDAHFAKYRELFHGCCTFSFITMSERNVMRARAFAHAANLKR